MVVGIINFPCLLSPIRMCGILDSPHTVGELARLPATNTCERMNTQPSEIIRQCYVEPVDQNC
jgi:hypothetical protein